MQLNELFPPTAFATQESFPSAVQILSTAINRIHFERRNARNVGFRGLRPLPMTSLDRASLFQGWTCKILHSPLVFAIIYLGESQNNIPAHIHTKETNQAQWSSFALLGFPPQEAELLEDYSLQAIKIANQDDYDDKIHNWRFNSEECAAFHLGTFYMGITRNIVKNDSKIPCSSEISMALLLESKEILRTISLDGVSYEESGIQKWLIEPKADDARIPAFSLLKPLFDTLTRTLGSTLQSPHECGQTMQYKCLSSSLAYSNQGDVKHIENTSSMIYQAVMWGKDLFERNKFENIQEFSLQIAKEFVEDMPLIHIISGFLGSGKTTFLREWLAYLQNKDMYMGVIQNEFGQIGLDFSLLKEDTVVEALDDGCVCCSLADSLRPGIQRILSLMPRQDILLETSGLANPNNVSSALQDLDDLVKHGLTISVSDAKLLQDALHIKNECYHLNLEGVSLSQIECVDIIVLNKIDLIDKDKIHFLRQALSLHNPRALIIESSFGRIAFALLDEIWDILQLKKQSIQKSFLKPMYLMNHATHADNTDGAYTSKIIHFSQQMHKNEIEKIIQDSGAIRVKGIVDIENEGICIVQHATSITSFKPIYFDLESSEAQKFYLVFIGKHLNHNVLKG